MTKIAGIFDPIVSAPPSAIREMDYPILKNSFCFFNREAELILTDHHLFIADILNGKGVVGFCPLIFDLKFDVQRHDWTNSETPGTPKGIQFERQNGIITEKITFFSCSCIVLEMWERQLQKKINQRNFHKLFKAKKKIGKGAFATVYMAERLVDKRMFAVKAFSKERQYASDKGRESLENEVKLMRSIDHRNVMKIECIFETENSIYVILEYLQGYQLNECLKTKKKFAPQEVKSVMKNLLSALSYFHEKRIIHRDLKPENIMFKHQGQTDLAICDFGLATFADEEKYIFVRCGTPGFVAPEIINIKDFTAKSDPISDVFSAGIIFHYLLFGTSIFPGKKYNEILAENRACNFDFYDPKYFEISEEARELLIKMLEKDPKKRINALKALKSSYFESCMAIESQGQPFKECDNTYQNFKFEPETPSTFYKKFKENRDTHHEPYRYARTQGCHQLLPKRQNLYQL